MVKFLIKFRYRLESWGIVLVILVEDRMKDVVLVVSFMFKVVKFIEYLKIIFIFEN